MNERFNPSGSFIRPAVSAPVSPLPVTQAASEVALQANKLVENPLLDDVGKMPGKKSSKATEAKKIAKVDDFEGNRFGISPLTLGLFLGMGLIAYGIYESVRHSHGSNNSVTSEIREYKRLIRPMDLPGR